MTNVTFDPVFGRACQRAGVAQDAFRPVVIAPGAVEGATPLQCAAIGEILKSQTPVNVAREVVR